MSPITRIGIKAFEAAPGARNAGSISLHFSIRRVALFWSLGIAGPLASSSGGAIV